MNYVTAARFSKEGYLNDEAVRCKADGVMKRLEDLALDSGLDPETNIRLAEGEREVRIGVSEDFDLFLREAPGEWRY